MDLLFHLTKRQEHQSKIANPVQKVASAWFSTFRLLLPKKSKISLLISLEKSIFWYFTAISQQMAGGFYSDIIISLSTFLYANVLLFECTTGGTDGRGEVFSPFQVFLHFKKGPTFYAETFISCSLIFPENFHGLNFTSTSIDLDLAHIHIFLFYTNFTPHPWRDDLTNSIDKNANRVRCPNSL